MVTYNTVYTDGLVIRTGWDEDHAGPVELLITLNPDAISPQGKGIPERAIRRLSLQSMAPESMKTLGSLRVVGDWLENHKPGFRTRPADPSDFYAHVALFFVLCIESGEKGVTNVLANYAGIRPSKAREWINTARRLGMLTENTAKSYAGRACGILTNKSRATLALDGELVSYSDAA